MDEWKNEQGEKGKGGDMEEEIKGTTTTKITQGIF